MRKESLQRERGCRVAGIILAAGSSSRIGKTKQSLAFGETTLLGQVVDNAIGSLLDGLILVLGHGAEEIEQAFDLERVRVVVNEAHGQGLSTSLLAGLADVSEDAAAAMFLLGDQPLVGPETINTIIDGYRRTRVPIVLPTYRGRRGNPVVIDRMLFGRIESLTGDMGARALFEEYADAIVEIEVKDDSILFDVDTWEDYEELKARIGDPWNESG